jgi:hypothetical protein
MSKIEVDAIDKQSGSTLTLGGSGTAVTLASGATQSGFGRTGTVDWDTTPKTASFNAVSGDGFFCNTTSSAFTATLPSGSAGAIVSFADYAGTWQTNNLTVSPQSGEKIGGESADVILVTEGQSVTFVYVDSTQGWINVQDSTSNERANPFIVATGGTVTTCGNDKIHTFTGPGTFTVCRIAACSANNIVSHIVVAGGGGGGANHGGGGGAGGYREVVSPSSPYTGSPLNGYPSAPNRVTVTATSFPIAVGGGGAAAQDGQPSHVGSSGTSSTFSTITSAGGGGGAGEKTCYPSQAAGASGGSGGGGSSVAGPSPVPTGAGGTGNTPPVSPAQGTNGGTGFSDQTSFRDGGGGGGATVAGTSNAGPSQQPNPGGAGATSSINGTPTARAGGGGGGRSNSPGGTGGSGGGGNGSINNGPDGSAGTTNTGGGGGGAGGNRNGGAGGSGIIIIRYKFQ